MAFKGQAHMPFIQTIITLPNPRISVIMSCFNAAEYVAEAIESILCQTYTDYEFIIIDDGSVDNTLAIIKRYAATDSRLVVIKKKNTGLIDSLNIGISESRGEWIARMDADDVSLPKRLEEQIAFLDRFPKVLLVGTDFIEINGEGRIVKVNTYPRQHNALLNNLRKRKRFFAHSSVMFRADVLKRIGKYNSRFYLSEDHDLWLRLAEHGEIACLNIPLVKFRKYSGNISNFQGGQPQLLGALAATVCHFLRSKGATDPSSDENDSDWQSFMGWLTLKVEQDGYFKVRNKWSQLRQSYFSSSSRILGGWRLVNNLVFSGCACRMLYEKLFGTYLPERLADEWSKK